MQNAMMELVERSSMREAVPDFEIGDTVDVHVRILEGDKERIQVFNGVVISRSGGSVREVFTVRRIVSGEGVERTFPVHSPRIADVVVKRSGKVRRAKLYYLRDRIGKAVRLKERIRGRNKATEAEVAAVKVQKREARKAKKAARIEARAQRAAEGPKPKAKKGAAPAAEGDAAPAEGAE